MDKHTVFLNIAVCRTYIAVSCLVTSNDNALLVGKVANTAILEGIELIFVTPA